MGCMSVSALIRYAAQLSILIIGGITQLLGNIPFSSCQEEADP